MIDKLKKNLLISLAFGAALFLGLSIYADYHSVLFAFQKFPWLILPVLLLLSYSNYIARFLEWDYYLRLLKVNISRKNSFFVFMSGLVMSVTPGKAGELLKAFLVKQINGEQISRTARIIMVERITDFISLLLIALVGAYLYDYGHLIVIGVSVFFFISVVLISKKSWALAVLSLFDKIKFTRKFADKILTAYKSSYEMLRPLPLIKMVLLSLVSWVFECMGFYLVLYSFNLEVSVFWSVFVYAFSTIIGAITMLPGGLGATEGSLTFMLIAESIPKDIAVAATFIVRVVTLWFAVLVGLVSVIIYQKSYGQIVFNNEEIQGHK